MVARSMMVRSMVDRTRWSRRSMFPPISAPQPHCTIHLCLFLRWVLKNARFEVPRRNFVSLPRGSCHLFNPPLTSAGFKREAFRKTKRRSMPPAMRRHRRQFCNISFVTSPGSEIWRLLVPTVDSTAALIVRGLPAVPRCCGPCR